MNMNTATRHLYRRLSSRRPLLLLLVGTLAVALVATFLEVSPRSFAAPANEITVTHHEAQASIKSATEDTCRVESRTTLSGAEEVVHQAIVALSKVPQKEGWAVDTNEHDPPASGHSSVDLILSQDFDMSDEGATAEDCSTESTIEKHRGRETLSLPAWARGLVAAVAAIAVYLAVVFTVTALFVAFAPEFLFVGDLVGGCVGGFASTFVANHINKVERDANLVQSAVQCISGALLNVTLGKVKTQMVTSLNESLHGGKVGAALEEGVGRSAGSSSEMSTEFGPVSSELGDTLQELFAEP